MHELVRKSSGQHVRHSQEVLRAGVEPEAGPKSLHAALPTRGCEVHLSTDMIGSFCATSKILLLN